MADQDEAGVQPAEIGARSEREGESSKETNPILAKFMALMLIIPGIFLYLYFLYIILFKLVYPGSFSPLLHAPRPVDDAASAGNTTRGEYY